MNSFRRCLIPFFILVFLIFFSSNFAYAKRWNVYPGPDGESTRLAIQAVIDTAKDGDVIYFNPGTYDFSLAPANYFFQNGGALQIIDKSLTIKGAPGSIIVGSDVVHDPDTGYMKGINGFWVSNSNAHKDVTFSGLTFQTLMIGIFSANTNGEYSPVIYYSNLRDLLVKDCTFIDMKRNGISAAGIQGNLTIANNSIKGSSSRFGMYIDWYFEPGGEEWQPKNTLVTIKDNSIDGFICGIYCLRPSNMLIKGNAFSNGNCGIWFPCGLKNGGTIANNTLSYLGTGIEVDAYTYLLNGVPFKEVAQGITLKYNIFSRIWNTGISFSGDIAHSNSIVYNTIDRCWGFGIYSEGYNNEYKNNIIQGVGIHAVVLSGQDQTAYGGLTWGAHNEYFKNNSVSGFIPQDPNNPGIIGWHYQLDTYTHDNTVIGIQSENATYVNNGTNNIFKFVYPYVAPAATTSLMSLNYSKAQNQSKKGTKRGCETI